MKRSLLFCMIALALFAPGGCTRPRPEAGQLSLPKIGQGQPQQRIDLTGAVEDKVAVKRRSGLFFTTTTYLPVSLVWLAEDSLLFLIMSENGKELLHTFRINPATGEVRLLEGAEKDSVQGALEGRFTLVSTETAGDEVLRGIVTGLAIAAQVAVAVVGGGGGSGSTPNFSEGSRVKTEQLGTALEFDLSVKRNDIQFRFSDTVVHTIAYTVKNARTGRTLTGETEFALRKDDLKANKNLAQVKAKTWLWSWRVSPDGRYYLIGDTATYIDPERNAFSALVDNFDQLYAGLDVSPRWDRVVLLRVTQNAATKRKEYLLEFRTSPFGSDH